MAAHYCVHFCLFVIVSVFLFLSVDSSDVPIIVETPLGKVQGLQTTMVKKFLGVPYAAPPVGKLRWKNTAPVAAWSPNTLNARLVKPGCPQVGCKDMNPELVCPTTVSEDCLYLNIWTPLNANSSSAIPVLVYFHGGNFVHMSSDSLLFDGTYLASIGEIIVVTVDYRLGILGFLVTPGATPESGATGNYGILDQRMALKWVQENIKSFGGDPNQVTLSGQSAGAQSSVIHLMSKQSWPYFNKVFIESSPFSIPYKNELEAILLGEMFANRLGCKMGDMVCMNNKTALEIATAQHDIRSTPSSLKLLEFFEPLGPYVDNKVVPFQPLEGIKRGMYPNIPIIIGTLTQETQIYVYEAWKEKPLSPQLYVAALGATFTKNALQVLEKYPPRNFSDERGDLVVTATDFVFTCCTRNYTRQIPKSNNIWNYVWDHAFSFDAWGPKFPECKNHVCHGSEIPYMFHSAEFGNFSFTPEEEILSDTFIAYLSNFVRTGNPNTGLHSMKTTWPQYESTSNYSHMHFQTPANTIGMDYRREFCDFWDSIGYDA